eukprot:1423520-Pleurochrysis_carterae.AAC.1
MRPASGAAQGAAGRGGGGRRGRGRGGGRVWSRGRQSRRWCGRQRQARQIGRLGEGRLRRGLRPKPLVA